LCTIVFNELLTKKPTTVAYENNEQKIESVYSKRIRAGKRRTYFFDVRATRSNDYFLTITESRKRFNDNGYDRHKIFLYKEDFNKFIKALGEAVDYVKTDLMPDFDFDAFNHDNYDENAAAASVDLSSVEVEAIVEVEAEEPVTADLSAELTEAEVVTTTGHSTEEVDKW
jgi:hypothetical protein